MWQHHDENLIKLKKIYNKVSKQTKNRLQEIFKTLNLNYDNLYNIADKKTKSMIDVKIVEWKDKKLLKGYFGVLANNIYNRTRVKNSEILELLIYSAYIEEQNKLDEYENQIIYDDMNYYYVKGQEEVNKSLPKNKRKEILTLTDILFLSLLAMNDSSGYDLNTYKQIVIKNNTDKLYRQAIININQQKELDIYDVEFQNIIDRQVDNKIKINADKIYGSIDHKLIEIDNKAKIEGIKLLDKNAKVKFIAVEDNVTTKMCQSLNNQIFNVHDWNEFYRYSKSSDRIVKYRCFGLIPGLNMPTIDDGFHFCRSTLVYVRNNIFSDNNANNIKFNNQEYGDTSILTNNIISICNKLHNIYKQNGYENIVLIDSTTQTQKGKISTNKSEKEVEYSIEQQNIMQMSNDRSLIVVHNHPSNNTFSLADIFEMIENRKVNGIIVTTDKFYYFLNADAKDLNIARKNIKNVKEWLYSIVEEELIKYNKIDNELYNNIYINIFNSLGWNYGRKRKV